MSRPRVLAIVQGGGEGSRMDVLTRERAKPSLPFAGVFQLIDFPMSNLRHSGIEEVWLSVQYQAGSLEEQASNGRPWELDRDRGGFRLLMPQQGGPPDADGFASGNADELFRMRDQIATANADVTVVLSSDHVYRFDYTDAIATHQRKQAECTVVTTEIALAEAGEHATIATNRLGRVTGFAYKPKRPKTGVVATEVFVYDTKTLLDVLDELHSELTAAAEPDPDGLGDFGQHLLPRLVQRGRVFAHPMPGYWRDLGRPDTYLTAHHDLVDGITGLFDDADWPILTRLPQRPPALVRAGARVVDSLLSPGCEVAGVVRRSVLGPGVRVEKGAQVIDSVVFADVTIEAGAAVVWSILDRGTTVGRDAKIGGRPPRQPPDSDHITMVGRDCRIEPESVLPGGARLEPGSTG